MLGSYEDWLARQDEKGAAVRVTDSTMEPRLYAEDIVRVEKLIAADGDVVCLRIDGVYYFGYRVGNVLERDNGPDLPLSGAEHEMGVATAVIGRDLRDPRFLPRHLKET